MMNINGGKPFQHTDMVSRGNFLIDKNKNVRIAKVHRKRLRMRRECHLRTGDVLNQLSYRCMVSQRASCCLHVRQLRDKLLNFSHSFGVVAFLKDRNITSLTQP